MRKTIIRIFSILSVLVFLQCTHNTASDVPPLEYGKGTFTFSNWAGPSLRVEYFYPESATADSEIIIAMHGAKRNTVGYRDQWIAAAQKTNSIVVLPTFTREEFKGSRRYNLGYLFTGKGKLRDAKKWSFAAIEPLFDEIRNRTVSRQEQYIMFGHSAGSQFVHRYNYFVPNARAKRYIAANAGWYTFPDLNQDYPYGLGNTPAKKEDIKRIFANEVIVLLGDQDIDTQHKSLRRTPEAMAQGPHRFARGQSYYQYAEQLAKELNVPFNWRLGIVKGAAHSNKKMANGAIQFIQQ